MRYLIVLAVLGLAACVEEPMDGRTSYLENCASCHGAAAMGDGTMAEFMSVNVPSLLELTQDNDGVFPMLDVIHIIDGRTGVRGHGSGMPVWGSQFKAEMLDEAGIYGSEIYARGKVLSLAYYLESIQSE